MSNYMNIRPPEGADTPKRQKLFVYQLKEINKTNIGDITKVVQRSNIEGGEKKY